MNCLPNAFVYYASTMNCLPNAFMYDANPMNCLPNAFGYDANPINGSLKNLPVMLKAMNYLANWHAFYSRSRRCAGSLPSPAQACRAATMGKAPHVSLNPEATASEYFHRG